jgi:hypothetical protein
MRYSEPNIATSEEDLPPLASHKAGHSPLPEQPGDKNGSQTTRNTPGFPKTPLILLLLAALLGAAIYFFLHSQHSLPTIAKEKPLTAQTPAPTQPSASTIHQEPAPTPLEPSPTPVPSPESTPPINTDKAQAPVDPATTPDPLKSQTEVAQLYHTQTSPQITSTPATPVPTPENIPAPRTSSKPLVSTGTLSTPSPTPASSPAGPTTFPRLTATNAPVVSSETASTGEPTPAPQAANTPSSSPTPSSAPTTPPGSIIAQNYEETSLNMQQVDVALFPKATELPPQILHLNVPIVHQKRLLSLTADDIAQFNNLLTRIQDTRLKQLALQKEMQAELAEYNALIQKGTPEAVLNADSPSLIGNTNSQTMP